MNSETFIVNVKCRENSTWQGKVTWAQKSKTKYFRSALELMKMLDGAMDHADSPDDIFEDDMEKSQLG